MSQTSTTPGRAFWAISIGALLWNLVGVFTYIMSVTLSPETLSAMPESEQALYTDIPAWATSAYAIAVFGGTLASIALLLRRSWAIYAFWVSLLAILVQMGHAFFLTALLDVRGAGAAVLPIVIIVIAVALLWYTHTVKQRGWLG